MIKVVTLLTRKPGMSREAFIEHYETHHRKIGEKYLSGFAVKVTAWLDRREDKENLKKCHPMAYPQASNAWV